MEAISCITVYWKGFLLGGIVGVFVSCGLLVIGVCLGGAKLNERHERLMERLP